MEKAKKELEESVKIDLGNEVAANYLYKLRIASPRHQVNPFMYSKKQQGG